jgi:hypothetical protein
MEEFQSKMVQVEGSEAVMLEPVPFDNRVSEAQLEDWLTTSPALAGEPLLILGSQLAEFAEDKDRLDVLSVDKNGEIVLLELKVDGQFRLTDLQALAYAAGYSALPPVHFAETLRRRLQRNGEPEVSLEEAQRRIVEFVDRLDEFSDWQPSKRVRIKLVAPGYPKRVLHTVKWLGDVYTMPIEAIQVQLYEDNKGLYQLTFERLLPLKSDDAFDLTVKLAEERIAGLSRPKKPAILKALLEHEAIEDGQKLWLHPSVFAAADKHLFDPENVVFQLILVVSNGKPMFRWRPTPSAPEQLLSPSRAWFSIFGHVLPGKYTNAVASPVFNHYSLEPGGPTLGEIAEQQGIW